MNEIEQAVQAFFHSFALRVLNEAGANPDSPQAVKQALLEHYEHIYPAFSQTEIFKSCPEGSARYLTMVEAYRYNFTLLLEGKIP
ncbi:hypothetical protein [Prevotella sp.]|uniref:hypothetical protein n=1 Tax=Prevotella sp. TaxID=59823 RepID=UPI002F95097F